MKKLCDRCKITYRKREKLSTLSERLRKKGRLNIVRWRRVQAWADIGNSAAHGKFGYCTEDDVANMLGGVENFLKRRMR